MLATQILNEMELLVRTAEQDTRPLELDPSRSRLFELFVTAHGAGLTQENASPDLSADGLCRELAERWGLTEVARGGQQSPTGFHPEHIGKMRLLWSLMRMWMEWTYAWQRWPEFHTDPPAET